MATYKEIQTQIAALQAQAEESRAAELDKAIREIKALMQDFGITIDDLQENKTRIKKGSKSKSKVVQFRDGENTWSGRGRMPGWMQGKEKEKFRV
jgi:DNA-binding protein H-NS